MPLRAFLADVVIGTETWLKPEIHDNEIFRPDLGYDVFRRDRKGKKGSGVVILVKRNMLASEAFDLRTNCENLWVKVQITGSRPLLIGAYYKPHEHDPESFKEFARSLDLASKLNCHTWIMGDINLPRLDWTTPSPDDNCNYSTFYRECIDTFNDHCLEQMMNLPTRGQNILDLFFTTNPTLVNKISTTPGISDHDAIIYAEVNIKPKSRTQMARKIPISKKANWGQ